MNNKLTLILPRSLRRVFLKFRVPRCTSGDEASLGWRQLYKLVIHLLNTKRVALRVLLVLHLFFAGDGASSQSLSSFSPQAAQANDK